MLPDWSELNSNVAVRLSFSMSGVSGAWSAGPDSIVATGRARTVQV